MSVRKIITFALITVLCLYGGLSYADDDELDALFTSSLAPDALIVLDLSGSMNSSPAVNRKWASNSGCVKDTTHCTGSAYDCADGFCDLVDLDHDGYVDGGAPCQNSCYFPYGATTSCIPNTTACSGTKCTGGFCAASQTGCSADCSRLGIAKRAIFAMLDDNGSNTITSADETSLGVRVGYMRFYAAGGDENDGYSAGANKLSKSIGNKYSNTYCGSNSSCAATFPFTAPSSSCTVTSVSSGCASGGTILATSLKEAKAYLDAHRTSDGSAGACRQKFIVFVSDGEDTYSCGGNGAETDSNMYKRRRASVYAAKALRDTLSSSSDQVYRVFVIGFGANMYKRRRASVYAAKALRDTLSSSGDQVYRVFVIGFGANMPSQLRNTLNWMAFYGGTDNPIEPNTGVETAYTVATTDVNSASGCANEPTGTTGADCPYSSNVAPCYAATRDPGNTPLNGYAFIAANADELANQMKMAFDIIREANYSFSQASVQLNRTVDENFIYEGTIQPVSGDPFWFGHLKKYAIDATTGERGAEQWDAGQVLAATAASTRNIKTYIGGTMYSFESGTTQITNALLGVSSAAERSLVIGFFRGEAAYNIESWKLGDIFRSKPITVGTPSFFFEDMRDTNNAFAAFRTSHDRKSSNVPCDRVVLVGANDGQLHAFKTSNGTEAWSFIPPNLLSRLKLIAHNTHPTSLTHQSYVDGPVTVADAWVPASPGSGLSKSVSDWKTTLIFGEGQGAGPNLWSSSTYCDSGFSQIYTATYPYYCGFHALDVTTPLSVTYKWRLGITAAAAPYMGAPWSSPQVGRVMDGGNEKWVAFIGGGYLSPGGAETGKGLFAFNMTDGTLLWSYTKASNSSLNYPMPAPPTIADTDSDGFIDSVYLGDMGANMWRFKLCSAADLAANPSCGTGSWTGTMFYDASASVIRPIMAGASVAKDNYNNTWVYWGTGDKLDPTAPNAQEKLFALKDTDRTSTWRLNDMENITSGTYSGTAQGWYINLTGGGEKMLAEPTVFGGVVYFTTYSPPGNDPCAQGGEAKLYGVDYVTGAAAIDNDGNAATAPVRSINIGTGIPSAPVVSMRPGNDGTPDLYITASGGGGTSAETARVDFDPRGLASRTNMIFWRDRRVE